MVAGTGKHFMELLVASFALPWMASGWPDINAGCPETGRQTPAGSGDGSVGNRAHYGRLSGDNHRKSFLPGSH